MNKDNIRCLIYLDYFTLCDWIDAHPTNPLHKSILPEHEEVFQFFKDVKTLTRINPEIIALWNQRSTIHSAYIDKYVDFGRIPSFDFNRFDYDSDLVHKINSKFVLNIYREWDYNKQEVFRSDLHAEGFNVYYLRGIMSRDNESDRFEKSTKEFWDNIETVV